MLKPLTIVYKEREITLECTHKKVFPPPQMYGHTPDDVDTLWKQGVIDQNQHQHLKTWKEKCGLMVMGPRCLDCPLALKQNPRPGRPHVIETEPWLPAKEQIRWEDMAKSKTEEPPVEEPQHISEVLEAEGILEASSAQEEGFEEEPLDDGAMELAAAIEEEESEEEDLLAYDDSEEDDSEEDDSEEEGSEEEGSEEEGSEEDGSEEDDSEEDDSEEDDSEEDDSEEDGSEEDDLEDDFLSALAED